MESDYVVWAASSINPMIAQNDPDRVALDVEAFESYVTAASHSSRGPRTILLSSGGMVYDDEGDPPYAETSPVGPRTAYGAAKLRQENVLLSADQSGLVLRISNAYGPGQVVAPGQGVIAHWMHAIAAGQDVHIFGDENVARDYVHVDDVSTAVAAAVELDYREHRVLNIGAGRPTTLRELFAMTAVAVGDTSIEPRKHPARLFDARSTWLDCSRAELTLGWRPRIQLAEGLAATWKALADQSQTEAPCPPATLPR
jgi:UDP-glucose 4-epimerase